MVVCMYRIDRGDWPSASFLRYRRLRCWVVSSASEAAPAEGGPAVEPGLVLVAPLGMTADRAGHGIPKPGVEVAADREPAGALAGEAVLLLVVAHPWEPRFGLLFRG